MSFHSKPSSRTPAALTRTPPYLLKQSIHPPDHPEQQPSWWANPRFFTGKQMAKDRLGGLQGIQELDFKFGEYAVRSEAATPYGARIHDMDTLEGQFRNRRWMPRSLSQFLNTSGNEHLDFTAASAPRVHRMPSNSSVTWGTAPSGSEPPSCSV